MTHNISRETRRACIITAREAMKTARRNRAMALAARRRGDLTGEQIHNAAAARAYHDAMSNYVAFRALKQLDKTHVESREHRHR